MTKIYWIDGKFEIRDFPPKTSDKIQRNDSVTDPGLGYMTEDQRRRWYGISDSEWAKLKKEYEKIETQKEIMLSA